MVGGAMRLLLVDGHYYLYRSFYAIRGLKNSRGEPTNAIYGYAKALRRMLADVRPDRAAVVWDCGLPERRTSLQPAYKQTRSAMPEDLRPQEEWLQENVPLFGPASVSAENTEADDLIASYTRRAVGDGAEVVIATNDKDILQLASERVRIYSTAKADVGDAGHRLLGVAEVRAKWGVSPELIADVLALTGDASDNIPGVGGIGSKTAVALVTAHGPVAAMLEDPSRIENEKLREKILGARDQILANREMVRLDEDLPLPHPWEGFVVRPRYPELVEALRNCEFKGLVREVEAEMPKAEGQGELFG